MSCRPPTLVHEIPEVEEYVDLAPLFAGPLVRIRHWRCLHDGRALREERASDCDVLNLTDHGAFVLHAAGRSKMVDPTCVVLQRAWTPYNTSHPFGCGDFGFSLLLRRDLMDGGDAGPAIRMAPIAASSRAVLRLRLAVRRLRQGLPVDPLAVEEDVLELLDEVLASLARQRGEEPARQGTERDHERTVEAARAFLWERFREPLKIDDVARAVHASPFHLARVFRRVTGETIHRYRHRLRLVAALEPVAEPSVDLTSLALDLGFSSHSHFTASFRRLFGMTPSVFRGVAAESGRCPPYKPKSA